MRLNADIFGLNRATWLAEADGGHFIATQIGAGKGWPLVAKRTLDVVASFTLLLLLTPLLVGWLSQSSLPLLAPSSFCRSVLGTNKRRFKIIKFRTMVPERSN